MKHAAALAGAAVLAGCAALPPAVPVAGARVEWGALQLDGSTLEATWFRPEGTPRGTVALQHGFARRCANLRETGLTLAAAGFAVLCLDADMARGGPPALASALADWLARTAPPGPVVVGGHSAGALFAAQVGAALARAAPQRLAGVLLFDPVDAGARLAPALAAAAASAPVLAILAPRHRCNAQGNARAALPAGTTVHEMPAGASHVDVEGGDSDTLAAAACGTPRAQHVARVRDVAVRWLRGRAAG